MRQTKDSFEFMQKVEALDPQQRNHMRILVEKLIECYLDTELHAVLVIGSDVEEKSTLLTVNCDEMEAAVVLGRLHELFLNLNSADAPPKEMMN